MNKLGLYCFIFFVVSACQSSTHSIRIKGSDSEVNLVVILAEEFARIQKDVVVSVSGGGSGLGIAALLNGNTDLANSSRSVNEMELHLFKAAGMELDSFVFARDAVAFIVSDQLPLDSLDSRTLAGILTGEIPDWRFIFPGKSQKITIYGRPGNSGTHEFICRLLNIRFSPYARQLNGNAQILEALKKDPTGIGYVSSGYVQSSGRKGIKVVRISHSGSPACSPLDTEAVHSGNYLFQRPLLQYFRRADRAKVQPFLNFESSPEGLQIIRAMGYYPPS
ncbi:MAG: substrate-binding domain-containing protein [Flavobacteriales bacterium]|nr:substrate-binding domain-containing protein [Flavobacteriales bacterium]